MTNQHEFAGTVADDIAGWLEGTEFEAVPTNLAEVREHTRRHSALALQEMPTSLVPASEIDDTIDGPGGPLAIRILRPVVPASVPGPLPTVVYLHGGGWVAGDIDTYLGHARRICMLSTAVVVSVAYRLAPENPFPAAFDDAVAVTEWAAGRLAELGGGDGPLVVAGDGVGGQLAASVAIARRDAGQPLAAQLLLYPVTDAAGRYADPEINAHYMSRRTVRSSSGLTLQGMVNFANRYVDEASAADWRVSPIRCENLAGVAPAVIHTATLDVLRTEGNFYGDALRRAGVPVIAQEFPTFNHSYFGLDGVAAVSQSASAQAAEDLAEVLRGHAGTGL